MKATERALAKQIGQCIAVRRIRLRMSQEQLAEMLGIGNEAVSRLERGLIMPSIGRLVEIADIFSCGTDELVMEMSTRAGDQGEYLAMQLAKLAAADRALVMSLLNQLIARLAVPTDTE